MTTALIGVTGQLGTDLLKILPGGVTPLKHSDLELTDPDSVEACLNRLRPRVVINTAAYNLVDKAEDEMETAFQVNAFGPARLASWCQQNAATLVHFSTDYVFGSAIDPESGEKRQVAWRESDCPSPGSIYAASKLSGENLVRATCERHFVVRTCGLYGVAATQGAGKGNFVETMLRLGRERDELSVVSDQCCTPTATMDLAQATVELLRTEEYGLYHATNSGQTTWFDLASEIFRLSNIDVRVTPITSEEFGARAARPPFSVLGNSRLESVIGRSMAPWQDALERYLKARKDLDS